MVPDAFKIHIHLENVATEGVCHVGVGGAEGAHKTAQGWGVRTCTCVCVGFGRTGNGSGNGEAEKKGLGRPKRRHDNRKRFNDQ